MNGNISHFAIYADDMERAASFYEKVFNWSFGSYGPPDFKQIKLNGDQPIGALQARKYSPIPEKIIGLECSVQVENIDEVAAAVEKAGGTIVMPKTEIPHVGWLIKFLDTEGSLLCAIQYR